MAGVALGTTEINGENDLLHGKRLAAGQPLGLPSGAGRGRRTGPVPSGCQRKHSPGRFCGERLMA